MSDERTCTCHPDDRPEKCPQKFAASECRTASTIESLQAENTRLRAALAISTGACVYCQLPADEWAKCQSGFPGCARADDAIGCPELGARLELNAMQERVRELEGTLKEIRDRQARHVLPWTHEQAANEYARMLNADRMSASQALGASHD